MSLVYDQAKAIAQSVEFTLKNLKKGSMLDIGSGFSHNAKYINRLCDRYLAIDSNINAVESLWSDGIDALYCKFPIHLNEKFDFVLSSHSLPDECEECLSFLYQAVDLLADDGTLMINTFKGSAGKLGRLRKLLGTDQKHQGSEIDHVIRSLEEIGQVEVSTFESFCLTDSVEELVQFIKPWVVKDPTAQVRDAEIKDFLMKEATYSQAWSFSIEHVKIVCRKSFFTAKCHGR